MPPNCPNLTVDTVIFSEGKVVLVQRKNPPFQGSWALPGGFVDVGETVETAAVREAREETGLEVELLALLGVYSDPARDPRGHTVSVVYLARPTGGELEAGDDAASARLFSPGGDLTLAFDHDTILEHALTAAKQLQLVSM